MIIHSYGKEMEFMADLDWLRPITTTAELRQAKEDGVIAQYGYCQPDGACARPLPPDLPAGRSIPSSTVRCIADATSDASSSASMPPVGGCCCAELAAAPSFAVRLAAPEGRPLWNTAKAELTKLSSSAAAGSEAAGSAAAGSEAAGSSSSLLPPLSWILLVIWPRRWLAWPELVLPEILAS